MTDAVTFGKLRRNSNDRTARPLTLDATPSLPPEGTDDMADRASEAAAFLKTLAHEGRLMILCHLCGGEKSVGTLEGLLGIRQAAVSQMLARLRDENLVKTRRDGKTVYYALADERTEAVIGLLHSLYCGTE